MSEQPTVEHIPGFDARDEARARQLLRIEYHLTPPALHNADERALQLMFDSGELHHCTMGYMRGRAFLAKN